MSHTFHSLPYPKHGYQRAKEADPKFNRYSNILPCTKTLLSRPTLKAQTKEEHKRERINIIQNATRIAIKALIEFY